MLSITIGSHIQKTLCINSRSAISYKTMNKDRLYLKKCFFISGNLLYVELIGEKNFEQSAIYVVYLSCFLCS